MSKLFNTLEQIRRNESYQVSGSDSGSSSEKTAELKRKKALFFLTLAVACFAVFYFAAPRFMKLRSTPDLQQPSGDIQAIPPVQTSISAGAPPVAKLLLPQGEPKEINDLAAGLINKNDHWRGIYLLDELTRSKPDMIEPFINISVALIELGLFEPAKRYLKEAMRINPENQALQDNLLILRQTGIIDKSFGPKIQKEAREAGRASWFSRRIPDGELFNRSTN